MTEEEEMAADAVMIADLQIIAACGLSYCLSSVVDVEIMDLDAATDLDVAAKVYSFFLILTSKGAVATDSTFSKYL